MAQSLGLGGLCASNFAVCVGQGPPTRWLRTYATSAPSSQPGMARSCARTSWRKGPGPRTPASGLV